jgi:transposase
MPQIHNNFSDEEVKQLLHWYETNVMSKTEVITKLNIKDSRFYSLLRSYRNNPRAFSVRYGRSHANNQLPESVVRHVRHELETDRRLVTNPAMPVMFYNYSAIRDAVEDSTGYSLSPQTIVNYAKKWGYYIERPKKKAHSREVLTSYVGMLLQHDASLHQWSPYAVDSRGKPIKWSLITTLDDHSRRMLYADMFEHETAWTHIEALESVILRYGVGIEYYSDNHAIFRYVADRDRNYKSAANYERVLGTDDVAPQWKQCVEATGMKVIYAMSPEAKGKIERPYRWLQDRIVRRAARENAKTINEVKLILAHEVDRYNNRQVHSTTKEIPVQRFERAVREGRSCFRPLDLKKTHPPVESTKDIFCLRSERRINGYGQITFLGNIIDVPANLPDLNP